MPRQIETAEMHAARRGNSRELWADGHVGSGAEEVLTDANLVFNLEEGQVIILCGFHLHVESGQYCLFKIVSTSAPDGAGDVTELSGRMNTSILPVGYGFWPAKVVKYSDGARSITLQVNTAAADDVVSCGWACWIEGEI